MKKWLKDTLYKKEFDEIEKILNKKVSELEEEKRKTILLQNDIHIKANKIELLQQELSKQDKTIEELENDVADLGLTIQMKNHDLREMDEFIDKKVIENTELLDNLTELQEKNKVILENYQKSLDKIKELKLEIEKLILTPSEKYKKDNNIPDGTHRIKLTKLDGKTITLENVSINWQVTKNFALWEIGCYQMASKTMPKLVDGKKVYYKDQVVNMPYMAKLQEFRTKLGKPLTITSGYRNSTVNNIVGGIPTSEHLYGRAMDLYTPGMTKDTMDLMYKLANPIFPSIGRYNNLKFYHLGDRDNWRATF